MLAERILEAKSDGSYIIFRDGGSIPMLRQEEAGEIPGGGRARLSLCDFLPSEGWGYMGMFATSVANCHEPECQCGFHSAGYEGMMERSVRVTLAEAASCWLDGKLRGEIHRDDIRIVKPAAGYACCPDPSLKKDILGLIPGSEKLEISLTESFAMIPDASICGFIFAHPEASYPDILRLSSESIEAYAQRRQLSSGLARNLLSHLG